MEGKHNQADQQPTQPLAADETTIAEAWQEQVAQAQSSAKLATELRQAPPALYGRFVRAYRDLLALSRARRRKLLRSMGMTLAGAALAFALALGQVPTARAATIGVGGSCTLVDAITAANTDTATGGCAAGSGADTITLSGNVTLTSVNNTMSGDNNGLPVITSVITIEGAGFTIARDAGAPEFRILDVAASGNLTLNDTTISGGLSSLGSGLHPGGINIEGGSVTLNNSTVSGNSSIFVSGINNHHGNLTLNNSTVSGNGNAYDSGAAIVTQSDDGSSSSTTTLINSTISGNSGAGVRVSSYAGSYYNTSGPASATLINTTITGNSIGLLVGTSGGGGLSSATLVHNLIAGNTNLEVFSSGGTITTGNYNVIGYGGSARSLSFTPSGSDIVPSQALTAILDTTLQNNGGDTETHALVGCSPAVDAAPTGPTTDQRGVSRPQLLDFDIGAFELEAQSCGTDLSVAVSDTSDPAAIGDSFTYIVTVTNNGPTSATSVSAATTLSGASATILSATSSQGSCSISAPTATCSLGTLANGASATITITVEPNATGTVTASSTVSASETDPTSGNNSDAESTTINNAHGCTITGTSGNDTLNGTNGADVICGLGGNDSITGGNGSDTIYAGSGNDIIQGGNSDDTIYAGPGDDSSHGETLLGILDNGSDTIYGGPGNDTLDGGNGNDTLTDTAGTDSLSGSNGNDTIVTQDGVGGDTANGGLGSDSCTVDGGDSTSGC